MRTEANSPVVLDKTAEADFVVVGGGLAGVCAAIAAARRGASVILVQNRPVLGGNCSSEMRVGILGAHGDENKEAGLLEELQLRNFRFNPLLRYTLWDDVLLSAVVGEPKITLLLNTSVTGVDMDGNRISAVKGWNGNAYTRWTLRGRHFADCSGDGILRLSGADFAREPQLAGDGRARFCYSRPFPDDNNFWWIDFGGNLDTVGDANAIQFELKRIAYGAWAYMKNHPDGRARGYDLDWIGAIPCKRESARFVGPRILTQRDVISGGHFEDVVAYGGWSLDDLDPDAFWRRGHHSIQHAAPSPFGIPFDCLYSVNVPNLMFAGRDISCTHMGLSAARVMGTCAALGQAVGTAAAFLVKYGIDPAQLRRERIAELQDALEDDDCMLPFRWRKVSPLTREAKCAEGVEVLKSGIDRGYGGADNGLWLAPGDESAVYEWDAPRRLSGARIVFDSQMTVRGKRMRKLEATTERTQMPAMLARSFRIDVRSGGVWRTVFADDENILRLRKAAFGPVDADALRLVVTDTWGGGKAHLFALDAF